MLTILLLLAAPGDTTDLMKRASAKLSAGCVEACAPVVKPSPYRIADDADDAVGGRTAIDDGSKCSIVGARVCTRKPRTMLRATLDR